MTGFPAFNSNAKSTQDPASFSVRLPFCVSWLCFLLPRDNRKLGVFYVLDDRSHVEPVFDAK